MTTVMPFGASAQCGCRTKQCADELSGTVNESDCVLFHCSLQLSLLLPNNLVTPSLPQHRSLSLGQYALCLLLSRRKLSPHAATFRHTPELESIVHACTSVHLRPQALTLFACSIRCAVMGHHTTLLCNTVKNSHCCLPHSHVKILSKTIRMWMIPTQQTNDHTFHTCAILLARANLTTTIA